MPRSQQLGCLSSDGHRGIHLLAVAIAFHVEQSPKQAPTVSHVDTPGLDDIRASITYRAGTPSKRFTLGRADGPVPGCASG